MANVTIDVGAKLDGRSLDRVELQIERQLRSMAHDQGVNFGRDFADGWASQSTRIERATDRSKTALDRLTKAELDLVRAQKSGDIEQIIRANERLAKVRRDLASQNDRLERSNRNLFESMISGNSDSAERQVRGLANSFASLGQQMQWVGKAAGTAGVAAIAPALGIAAGAAAQASGAIGLLPGVLGTAAAGFGTLKLATNGFSDALDAMNDPKKFAEALNGLSPAAQQAAIQIKALVDGPLGALQKATQDALFKGIGPGLNSLATTLTPQLSTMTTGIASALNQALTGVMGQLQTPQNMASIGEIVNNIVQAFRNLAPAARPFTDAMAQLTSVSTSFLPQLATSISQGAQAFSQFISEASRSGQLQDWIQGGIDAMKQLGPIIKDALAAFMAMRPIGETVLPLIRDTVHGIAVVLETISPVVAKISPLFLMWKASVLEVKGAFEVVGNAIDFVGSKINRLLDPLRAVAAVSNQLLGTNIQIPQLGTIAGTPVAAPGQPGGPGGPLGSNAAADAWLRADQAAHPNSPNGLPPGAYRRRDGSIGYAAPPSAQDSIPSPLGGPYSSGGGSGPRANGPQVPYPGTDPRELIKGFPLSGSLYQSAQAVLEAQYQQAQKQAELNALMRDNNATAAEIQSAQNALVKSKQDEYEAELRLAEAKKSATDSQLKASDTASKAFSSISAGLDKDLGISQGLPGLADNLVRFIGAIATAPLMGALSQITGGKDASETGSGLIGMFAGASGYGQPTSQYLPYQQQYAPGGYPGDSALLANVPAGRYSQSGSADLVKGLGDCSSAVEDLVNILDGRPTGGRQMSTGNAAEWLTEHGFLPGEGGPGDFRVGYNADHMQATLPGGTPFNWGSDAAAARGGVGGTGAYDPSFTEHYYRPTGMSGSAPWSPSYSGGGGALGAMPSAAPTAPPTTYAPLTDTQLTDPGLSTPAPTGGGMGSGAGTPGIAPPPQSLPGLSSGQINNPGSDPNAWQPQGGGAGFGGLPAAAISSAISAAGMAGDAAGGGGGGSATAAAAQMLMQLANRSIKFGGQAAGDLVGGLFETLSVGGSSLADPMQGWIGRAIGGLIGATPQLPSMAGDRNQQGQLTNADDKKNAQGQPGQPQGQDAKQGKNGGITIMGDWVNNVPNATAQQLANNLNFASAGGNSRSGG